MNNREIFDLLKTEDDKRWFQSMCEKINAGERIVHTTTNNSRAKVLVALLNERIGPPIVKNLGGGTKEIDSGGKCCPTCQGRGFI